MDIIYVTKSDFNHARLACLSLLCLQSTCLVCIL